MQARRYLWLMVLTAALAACAGGSGSSGFDVTSENAAIRQALDEQHCVTHQALMICPAEETSPTMAAATPTPSPLRTATPPVATGPTATPTPTVAPHVATGVSLTGGIACAVMNGSQMCSVLVPFVAQGFPSSFVYRVAARTDPNGSWTISAEPVASGIPSMPNFDAAVGLNGVTSVPSAGVTVQLAILVFDHPPEMLPAEVDVLADTGALDAFVTTGLTVQLVPSGSGRQSP